VASSGLPAVNCCSLLTLSAGPAATAADWAALGQLTGVDFGSGAAALGGLSLAGFYAAAGCMAMLVHTVPAATAALVPVRVAPCVGR
jgi:hypothetical protein